MIDSINEYHELSKELDSTEEAMSSITSFVFRYAKNFLKNTHEMKSYYPENNTYNYFLDEKKFNERSSIEEIFDFIENSLDKSGINSASSNNFGYIPGYGIYISALADFITSISNRFSTVYAASPEAVKLENSVVNWICNLVGYGEGSGGVLTSGGSLANLIAIVAARDHALLSIKNSHNAVVYLTEYTHHSIHKALKTAGMGDTILRDIKVNNSYKMDPSYLKVAIEKDLENGLFPWMVVVSAGTTDIGSVDPISEIQKIAQKFNIWLHVDAAYGGFFILTEKGKELFQNIHLADSITMDPHKSLFLPYGIGSIVVKKQALLFQSFARHANYLRDVESNSNYISPADLSPELSRNLRGLRLWLPLKLYGIKPFKAALEEKLLLAKYFYEEIKKINGIEIACEPELSIVTFRYIPENKEQANLFNQDLVQKIQQDGEIFLSSTTLNKNVYLRLACLLFKSHLINIDYAIKVINEKINSLLQKNNY